MQMALPWMQNLGIGHNSQGYYAPTLYVADESLINARGHILFYVFLIALITVWLIYSDILPTLVHIITLRTKGSHSRFENSGNYCLT